ncbi:hypothetical protein [Pseudomonas japonica]|nr:hypothetical protein [Pseudomonas japonica]
MKGLDVSRGVMVRRRNAATALDSLRSNLACEVTDNILCSLPLSADYGLYRMLRAVAAGATLAHLVTNSGAGLRHRQISRMNNLFPNARIRTLHGLPVEQPLSLGHCRDGLSIRPVPAAITVKTTLPGTGSGRVDFVLPRRWACNEQRGVAG